MSHYYYLAASLPALAWDTPPPISTAAFRTLCKHHLDADGQRALEALDLPPESMTAANPFVSAWRASEVRLRNGLTRVRAHRLKVDAVPHLVPEVDYDTQVDRVVHESYAAATPLDRERILDRFRWAEADRLAGFDPFTLEALLAYAVKLKLVERWATFQAEAGRQVVEALVDRVEIPAGTSAQAGNAGTRSPGE